MVDMSVDIGQGTVVLGGALAVIVAAMGGWSTAMTVLVWLLVLDFILGTARSAVQGRLSSLTSIRKTGIKVVLLWALTTFASQLDCSLSTGILHRGAGYQHPGERGAAGRSGGVDGAAVSEGGAGAAGQQGPEGERVRVGAGDTG
jgi:hypothetical protein